MTTLGTVIISFFRNHLANEKGVAENTIKSYSDCIRLLLDYACKTLNITIDKLALDTISEAMILDFLDHLEQERNNVPATRNQRLGAIKTFFRFLARQEPTLTAVCERVCDIRCKKSDQGLFQTLQTEQVQAILNTPDPDSLIGARNAVLLGLLYNTGARVQELVDLNLTDIRLENPQQAMLTGKGRKQRVVPLWEQTASAIKHYIELRKQAGIHSEALLLNAGANRISRFGVNHVISVSVAKAAQRCPSLQHKHVTAHTFRHTVALHLLQAGEDIVTIKELLGHADIKTTSQYIEIDLEMKRRAIERCMPRPVQPAPATSNETLPRWQTPKLLSFLKDLSKSAALC